MQTRVPVHVQVVGTPRNAPNGHFYGLTRNLSVHGMLLASPVKIDTDDLDLEIDLPEPEGRVRVLGRVVREAPDVGWPYIGYGIEFLFLPETGQRSIERMVTREGIRSPRARCGPRAPSTRRCAGRSGSTSSPTRFATRRASWWRSAGRRAGTGARAAGAPSTSSRARPPPPPSTPPAAFVLEHG